MRKCLVLIQCAVVVGFGSGCIVVPPYHNGRAQVTVHHPHAVAVRQRTPRPAPQVVAVKGPDDRWVQVTINPRERQVIREYVVHARANARGHGEPNNGRPKGIAKKAEPGEPLPPGWQRKCVRGQVMPMAVFKHCQPLPHDVLIKLTPPPTGTILVTLEGKVMRLMQATLEILDAFDVI